MAIVAGFDVHRAQITFDALNRETGEVHGGRIQATPEAVRRWVRRLGSLSARQEAARRRFPGPGPEVPCHLRESPGE